MLKNVKINGFDVNFSTPIYKFAEFELETQIDTATATGIINKSLSEHDSLTWNSKLIEARYAFENEFLFAITQGNYPKAKHLISQFNSIQVDQRNSDPIRDLKNYCLVINTLFRKSVERGGVHPIHIDSVSGEFAKKIIAEVQRMLKLKKEGKDLHFENEETQNNIIKEDDI